MEINIVDRFDDWDSDYLTNKDQPEVACGDYHIPVV